MKTTIRKIWIFAGVTLMATPVAVSAHEGHAGHHWWLQGALQPLLSLDHLLAGLTVLGVGAVAFATLGRAVAARREAARSDPPA